MKSAFSIIALICLFALSALALEGVSLNSLPDMYVDEDLSPMNGPLTTRYAYSEPDARIFAAFSAASYCLKFDTAALDAWTCKSCKDTGMKATDVTRFLIAATKTQGYVSYIPSKSRIILTFTGSANFDNWMSNLDFTKVAYPGCTNCQVHHGFYTAYLGARTKVIELLSGLIAKYPGSTVSITGHSLGAALATHAILDIKNSNAFTLTKIGGLSFVENGNESYDTVTSPLSAAQVKLLGGTVTTGIYINLMYPMYIFGGPRTGDAAFAAWFMSRLGATSVYRLTHNRDPVPHLPPLAFGFAHSTSEVFYNKDSTAYTVCSDSDGEDKNCSDKYKLDILPMDHAYYGNQNMKVPAEDCLAH